MNKQLSDERLDQLMRTVVRDVSLEEHVINNIADSPTLWWAIQREINERKEVRSPWPPSLFRWLGVGAPILAALALVSIFIFRPTGEKTEQAGLQQNVATASVNTSLPIVSEPAVPANYDLLPKTDVSKTKTVRRTEKPSFSVVTGQGRKLRSPATSSIQDKKTEIKSDFIALSYASSPESGQVVRVKVPSSMMVALGLVSSVEKPANLVDAEVVVGDDGMTHAIRFIR